MRHIVTLKNNREFGKVYNQKESFANKYLVSEGQQLGLQ